MIVHDLGLFVLYFDKEKEKLKTIFYKKVYLKEIHILFTDTRRLN